MPRRTKIERVERQHAAGYAQNGLSQHTRRVAYFRSDDPPIPKIPKTREEAIQQNKSRVGRLRAQLKTETNAQMRLLIMRELEERNSSAPSIADDGAAASKKYSGRDAAADIRIGTSSPGAC
jgi:hypothetical protein